MCLNLGNFIELLAEFIVTWTRAFKLQSCFNPPCDKICAYITICEAQTIIKKKIYRSSPYFGESSKCKFSSTNVSIFLGPPTLYPPTGHSPLYTRVTTTRFARNWNYSFVYIYFLPEKKCKQMGFWRSLFKYFWGHDESWWGLMAVTGNILCNISRRKPCETSRCAIAIIRPNQAWVTLARWLIEPPGVSDVCRGDE